MWFDPSPDAAAPSHWDLVAPARPERTPPEADVETALAVVGGGLVGLATAWAAAQRGIDVTVLEREWVGAGASGRTSGFVAPTLRPLPGGRSLREAIGDDRARRFRALSAGSGRRLFELIDALDSEVPVSRSGWIAAAHTPGEFERLQREADPGNRILNARQVRYATGIDGWFGGVVRPDGGAIDPLAYVTALAAGIEAGGGRVFENCPADTLTPNRDGRVTITAAGRRIVARHVIIATNAADSGLISTLARAIVPVTVFQIVTAPLPPAYSDVILPKDHVVTDTTRNSLALRWTPDGRLLTGGLIGPSLRRPEDVAAEMFSGRIVAAVGHHARRLGDDPSIFAADRVWSGRIALTGTGLPALFDLAPGITGIVACNGRGIALGTALGLELGEVVADCLAGRDATPDFNHLPLPMTRPRANPLRFLSAPGSRLRVPWTEMLDRRDRRASGAPQRPGAPNPKEN